MQLFNNTPNLKPLSTGQFVKPTIEDKKEVLKGQAEEFAGLLYAQLVREMRESGKDEESEEEGGGGIFGGGDSAMFMQFFDQQVGKTFAKQSGSALKDALYRQLTSQLDTQDAKAKGDNQ